MTRSNTVTRKDEYNRLLHAIVFAIAMLSISLHGPIARADIVVASHDRQVYSDVDLAWHGQTLAISDKRPPRRLRFKYVPETSYGAIPTNEQRDALVAFLAFDEVPQVRATYVNCQQRCAG